jgi:predicted TIM-barrel fold metal-dependent hydrolase
MRSRTKPPSRRDLLRALGASAGLAGTAAASPTSSSDAAAGTGGRAGAEPLRIVDFHNHYVGPAFDLTTLRGTPAAMRAYWEAINRNLSDPGALISSMEEAGISARVINTPTAFIQDADGEVPPGTVERINDQLAELVSRHPGRLYGLATVDAYSGESGARELTRAVRELGLRGVFVESAKKDLLPDAPRARPTLAAAAALGVPVFVHPVNDPALSKRFAPYRRTGAQLARGTINSAALLALLEGGVFDELPNLRVVVTTLAIGGILVAGAFGDGQRLRRDTPESVRRHVYIDTMGLHPALIGAAVEMLGADHVLVGTDWPIFVEKAVPERVRQALTACGLTAAEQHMISGGNTLRLLGVS